MGVWVNEDNESVADADEHPVRKKKLVCKNCGEEGVELWDCT